MTWSAFDSNGRFMVTYKGSEPTAGELDGMSYIAGDWDDGYYHDSGLAIRRNVMLLNSTPLTVSVGNPVTITQIPVGTTVTWSGGSQVINDGEITWSANNACQETFTFSLFPYLDTHANVTVTD